MLTASDSDELLVGGTNFLIDQLLSVSTEALVRVPFAELVQQAILTPKGCTVRPCVGLKPAKETAATQRVCQRPRS